MKTKQWLWPARNGFLTSCLLLSCAFGGFAQSSGGDTVPVVTLEATVPIATWAGQEGAITVWRSGNSNMALNVYYCISGTASNGVDYQTIGQFAYVPAGAMSNSIVIKPIDLGQTNLKTVTLSLCPSPLMMPVNFGIGLPSNATVYITPPNDTNIPPVAGILSPANGAVYYTPVNILLLAQASAFSGTVTNVEFFAGTNDLGQGFPVVLDPPGVGGVTGLVYLLDWLNVPTNHYLLTAVATDGAGASTTSAPVKIAVLPEPPVTNLPPVVRIIAPPDGSVFRAPVSLPLYAYAADPDGAVTNVEFFAGTNSVGPGDVVTAAPPPLPPGPAQPPILMVVPTNYWGLVWSNAPLGTNIVLTARAADNGGATTVSAPVTISVVASPPPATNWPPVVNISATDPIAIESTNDFVWSGETNSTPTWAAWPTAVCRLFTNYGPKTATFTVSRRGETNDELTLAYSIGGTASNGVDYVAIPGFVTIPSGGRSALVTIMPIDDGPPDITKTVTLTLTPSTHAPPDYQVGYPGRAAAIIFDSSGPMPVTSLLPDKSFQLAMPGPNAAWFGIEYSTNLAKWVSLCTNQVINGSINFVDPDAQSNQARYYRATPLTNPPSE